MLCFYFTGWDNSELKHFMKILSPENIDLQSNLVMMDKMEFEGKVDIDDLVLPSKPLKLAEFEINDIKQEPIEEEEKQNAFQLDHDEGEKF